VDFAADKSYDAVVCVLAIQNMEKIEAVFNECERILKSSGRFIFVLNHPAFRIPRKTSWGWDEANMVQYRRVDGYLSSSREQIDMFPSQSAKKGSTSTWSFHRSLQDYMKALARSGFAISKLEEWISHKTSERGPRQRAEDIARKEFPLFMLLVAQKIRT
jgi:ubiquinone/menaquinone biosynthesis C-methylase UbiE